MAVLVLEPLTVERGAPGGGAEQEPAAELVTERPHLVASPLKSEHRVEDVHRDHMDPMGGIRGARGYDRTHRAGFVDALVQHLAGFGLLVGEQQVAVDRLIALPVR